MSTTFPNAGLLADWTPDVGNLDFLPQISPAAGANLTLDLGRYKWLVLESVIVTLATDANAANRFLSVDYIPGGRVTAMRNAPTVLITANTTATVFQFDRQHTVSEWNTGTMVFAPLLPLALPVGWTVKVTVDNIQVGDTLTACTVVCRKFYEPREEG